MNIIHDVYGIYALDCLIRAAYMIYQAVGRTHHTPEKIAALKQSRRHDAALVIITFTPVGNELGSPWMHPPEEPPSRAEAGYWFPMLEKAGVQIRRVRPLP
jgi:hypothetical protein